ncbi:hypothetical protein CDCA_CDCA09G2675 [Cyanidium caldarium]|uniref:Golgi apparatus membrane protein TVP23 homolog n=1 Tax=Cyanidium caldarium TaxID=2771 RepID=A0AAV9IX11_CYACA|nr:hypothetical protein CDCA_CDCA09G2675 [Cyanidium caldarium]
MAPPEDASLLRDSAHPLAIVFLFGFKLAAIATFLLLGFFTSSFVVQAVLTLLLLAADFWTVKNVSGRLLVGLRWWNEVHPQRKNILAFEYHGVDDAHAAPNRLDKNVFWWTLYCTPSVWVLLGLVCVLKLELTWLLLVAVALVLNVTQLVAYWKCHRAATRSVRDDVLESVGMAYVSRQWNRWFGGTDSKQREEEEERGSA